MIDFTIGITTFSKRFDFLAKLIEQIRGHTDKDILIAINGDYNKKFEENYRKNILHICLKYQNIFPIFFPEQRSLSKLWNTLIIHSKNNWNLILNDDIEILSRDVFIYGANHLPNKYDLLRINGSFSHFFVHKNCIDELGYFDERLLGFGEEDGDIFYRYIELYNTRIQDLYINGLNNLVIDIRDENIKPGNGKYSAFNRDFCFYEKNCKYIQDKDGITGIFGHPMKKSLPDLLQYPYEKFFRDRKKEL